MKGLMMVNTKLSAESKTFLENLRVYLFSSGKNEGETEEIIEELEVHLLESEKQGKPIEKIIGQTPKEYMKQLANEMPVDYSAWFKYIPIIILGAFSFDVFGDLIQGELAYSVLELFGHLLVSILFFIVIFWGFKYISTNIISLKGQALIFLTLSILPIGLFFGLVYLNRVIETPVIHFGVTGSVITAIVMLLFIIAVSIWAKSWIIIVLLTIITLPEYLLEQTAFQESTKLVLDSLIIFGGIGIYFLITYKMDKEKE